MAKDVRGSGRRPGFLCFERERDRVHAQPRGLRVGLSQHLNRHESKVHPRRVCRSWSSFIASPPATPLAPDAKTTIALTRQRRDRITDVGTLPRAREFRKSPSRITEPAINPRTQRWISLPCQASNHDARSCGRESMNVAIGGASGQPEQAGSVEGKSLIQRAPPKVGDAWDGRGHTRVRHDPTGRGRLRPRRWTGET